MTGWRGLFRLAWRRDRVMIGVCLVLVWLLSYYSAAAMPTLYSSTSELVAANEAGNASTGVVAMYGHVYDTMSVGGVGANKLAMIDFLVLAFLVIAVVRRHTRGEEESGRFELLGATPVGRLAPLGAAVLLAVLTSVVSGVVTIPALVAGSFPVAGSILFGLAQVGVGLAFTGLTAIAVQVSSSYRACGAWIFGALGASFVVRMIGDVSWDRPARVLSWFSPLGWAQQVRYYDGDRPWPLVIPVVFFAVTLGIAGWLQGRRDLGAGLLPDRVGRPHGRIGTPLGLAWRLQRPAFIGWLVMYVLMGVVFGSIIDTIGGLMSGPAADLLTKLGGVGGFNDIYLTLVASMGTLAVAAYGVSAVMRIRSEESEGHLESVLATPVTRGRFLASHLVVAYVGSVVLMASIGLAMAASHRSGSSGFWREALPALAHLPAAWVMIALAAGAAAWLPRFDWLGWALLGGVVAVGELGAIMGLPDWVLKISPFAHTPKVPVEAMSWPPEIILTAITVALLAVAYVGYRRRGMPVA